MQLGSVTQILAPFIIEAGDEALSHIVLCRGSQMAQILAVKTIVAQFIDHQLPGRKGP
ncbi:MAG: hypothetical protein RL095_3804 [Verrucomicrobiota bacterium]